jgi:hypothetical protein
MIAKLLAPAIGQRLSWREPNWKGICEVEWMESEE